MVLAAFHAPWLKAESAYTTAHPIENATRENAILHFDVARAYWPARNIFPGF